jgi:hypothetical protein
MVLENTLKKLLSLKRLKEEVRLRDIVKKVIIPDNERKESKQPFINAILQNEAIKEAEKKDLSPS